MNGKRGKREKRERRPPKKKSERARARESHGGGVTRAGEGAGAGESVLTRSVKQKQLFQTNTTCTTQTSLPPGACPRGYLLWKQTKQVVSRPGGEEIEEREEGQEREERSCAATAGGLE